MVQLEYIYNKTVSLSLMNPSNKLERLSLASHFQPSVMKPSSLLGTLISYEENKVLQILLQESHLQQHLFLIAYG